ADERLVLIELIETAAVDPDVVRGRAIFRIAAHAQLIVERDVFRVVLAPVNVLEIAARGDHLFDERLLARRVARVRERHLDFLVSGETLVEVGRDLQRSEKGGGEKDASRGMHSARLYLRSAGVPPAGRVGVSPTPGAAKRRRDAAGPAGGTPAVRKITRTGSCCGPFLSRGTSRDPHSSATPRHPRHRPETPRFRSTS